MIHVKIYCTKDRPECKAMYQLFDKTLKKINANYQIQRICRAETIKRCYLVDLPLVTINGRVVYAKMLHAEEDIIDLLQKLKLLK